MIQTWALPSYLPTYPSTQLNPLACISVLQLYLFSSLFFVVPLSVMTCLGLFHSWLQHMKELNLALEKTFWWKLLQSPQVLLLVCLYGNKFIKRYLWFQILSISKHFTAVVSRPLVDASLFLNLSTGVNFIVLFQIDFAGSLPFSG